MRIVIFAILQQFYDKAAKRPVRTGMVLAYRTSGEFLRWNPHFHCLVLEGGFDDRGKFVHIPLGDIQRMSEYFRRSIIKLFLKRELISARIATSLINWKHSGFSVDHSIRIPAFSIKAREALSQYIARPPLALKKIGIEENREATVISFTSQSEFFKGKTETFPVIGFFLELSSRRSPAGGIFPPRAASTFGVTACMLPAARANRRCPKGGPDKPHVVRLAPAGWKKQQQQQADQEVQPYDVEQADPVSDKESRSPRRRSPEGRRG